MDIKPTLDLLHQQIPFVPELAIILGSGLGPLADCSEANAGTNIYFRDLPGFPDQSVIGHSGRLIFCELEKRKVILQAGRFHYYEGHPMSLVTAPMRIYGRLGVKVVLLTNAAGAVNPNIQVGSLMVIKDHINLQGINPLTGPNVEPGTRFPDMSSLYNTKLRQQLLSAGTRHNQELFEGVYLAVSGPSYETPAEIRAFHLLGADAVGMSTAPEAIVAHHEGMLVAGISCISNMGAGILKKELNHQEALNFLMTIGLNFEKVVREFVRELIV
ncbi:MAG: purine-nucleoside phosphorylase [Holophagales bacterium]|jgi:purine-nucleoside phosphorylase|nr:purine-nucleoside phosphorylase [Holophagales bacterium]